MVSVVVGFFVLLRFCSFASSIVINRPLLLLAPPPPPCQLRRKLLALFYYYENERGVAYGSFFFDWFRKMLFVLISPNCLIGFHVQVVELLTFGGCLVFFCDVLYSLSLALSWGPLE